MVVDFCPQANFYGCIMSAKSHTSFGHKYTLNLIFLLKYGMFWNKFGLNLGLNEEMWTSESKTNKNLFFIQKCPQFSKELSASNACMLATFSVSVQWLRLLGRRRFHMASLIL